MLNYRPLLRQSFLEPSLVVSTLKSNFSNERCGVVSKWLLAMFIFIEKPFCCFWLIRAFFLCTREWSCHDIQCFVVGFCFCCFVLFSGETTYYTSWITYCNGEQLFQKNVLTDEHAVSFWREPTEGSLLLRLGFSIFIPNSSMCINDYVLCQHRAWHFKKSWMS